VCVCVCVCGCVCVCVCVCVRVRVWETVGGDGAEVSAVSKLHFSDSTSAGQDLIAARILTLCVSIMQDGRNIHDSAHRGSISLIQ
jgi:hypothetical protein